MRDRAWLDAVRDRVLAEIREHPPAGPLLGERAANTVCQRGHAAIVARPTGHRLCVECARLARRKELP